MVVTKAEIRDENIPGYTVELNPDTFRWEAKPVTEGGPIKTGTYEGCLRFVAAEQGWSRDDLEETLAVELEGYTPKPVLHG